MMVTENPDVLSEILIAQLLEEDLQSIRFAQAAEKLQLDQTISLSLRGTGRIPKVSKQQDLVSDADIALSFLAADARASSDMAYAESLSCAEEAAIIASKQYALRLAAAEKKFLLDAEFAKRLQAADDNDDVDMDNFKDSESLLSRDEIERILSADLNSKGKGKGVSPGGMDSAGDIVMKMEEPAQVSIPGDSICGICYEGFKKTHSPLAASQSANSSNRLPFGMIIPCPGGHSYCLSCLSAYIMSKLDPSGDMTGSPDTVVFPIHCPECPAEAWDGGFTDDLAGRVLSEKKFVLWHHQKLLDSIERHYCPNPRCSALVQIDEDTEDPQAICPSCRDVMCVPCKTKWHDNLTCEEYQELPEDERSPEDQLVLLLAKAQKWRRCPKCTRLVELSMGCNHITCLCGTHFCFKCGAPWDARCTRNPPCDLWDENMLLEERERDRAREQVAHHQPPQPVAVQVLRPVPQPALPPPPPYIARPPVFDYRREADLSWLNDSDFVCARHSFTTNMLSSLTCGYCNSQANSLRDLIYHLEHVRRHDVFACCGRLFRHEIDFDRHTEAGAMRFEGHSKVLCRPAA